MTDTTNMPPLPAHPYGQAVSRSIKRYGDARAAHAVAQNKARIEHMLASMTQSVDGRDPDQSGTSYRKGWNAALRQASDYLQAGVVKAREVTDAEIDALFESLGRGISMRDTLRKFARAAIALANGRGGA